MDKRVTALVAVALMSFLFVPLWPAGNALHGQEQAPVQGEESGGPAAPAGEVADPQRYISDELGKVGLETGEIEPVGGDEYLVNIERYEPGSEALTEKGKFRPCSVRVKMDKGKVVLERCGLEDAGLQPVEKNFPSSMGIDDGTIWGRPY